MIDVVALQSLLAIDAHGTVASAAANLGYTPSAVSQQVKRLEVDLGAPLLERVGRGVVLTPQGRLLVREGRRLLDDLEGVRSRVASSAGDVSGTVQLVAFSTAVRGIVAPLVAELRATAPALVLHVVELDPAEAVDLLVAGRADLALIHNWVGVPLHLPSGLEVTEVGTDVADVLVHRDSPLARRQSVSPADLLDETWATTPPGSICHAWFLHMYAGHSRTPTVRFRSWEFASHVRLVEEGAAVALVPRLGRGPLPDAVVPVAVREPTPMRTVLAVCRTSMAGSPAIRHVLDRLLEGGVDSQHAPQAAAKPTTRRSSTTATPRSPTTRASNRS